MLQQYRRPFHSYRVNLMHASSQKNMRAFIDQYLKGIPLPAKVLDVGSQDVNGTYKSLFKGWGYTGLDVCPGKNVDVVVKDIYYWQEVQSAAYDAVISGQTLEHVEFPWLTMCEVARVLKPGGLCCIIVPSAGPIHTVVGGKDCWRILPHGLEALAGYAGLEVIRAGVAWASISSYEDSLWQDAVLVCRKPNR